MFDKIKKKLGFIFHSKEMADQQLNTTIVHKYEDECYHFGPEITVTKNFSYVENDNSTSIMYRNTTDHPVLSHKYFMAKDGERYGLLLTFFDDMGIIYLVDKYKIYEYLYFEIEKNQIYISDISFCFVNIGIGTEAMDLLIEFGKTKSYKKIFGKRSDVDNDHTDRRDYFYRKLGFDVGEEEIKLLL